MGINHVIQKRLLTSAKSFVPKDGWRPGETPLRMVGLILCLEDSSELDLIKRVKKLFTDQGAACHICIFRKDQKLVIPEEVIDDDTILLSSDSINWYGAVRPGCAEFLVHESFDLMLNLSKEYFFSTSYLAALTNATIKIGRYIHPHSSYRLVLGTNDHDNSDAFFELLERCLHFVRFE